MSKTVTAQNSALLITWTLWSHLIHPVAHPLFQRTLRPLTDSLTTSYIQWMVPLGGSLACCAFWTLSVQFKPSLSLLLLMALTSFSSLYVVAWVIGISDAITRKHEHRTYDPLCILPSGTLGACWAMCAATLHRHDALGWISLLRKLITGFLLFILLVVLMTTALRQNVIDVQPFVWLFLDIIAVGAVSYFDHIQSTVMGSLVAMLVPVYSRTRIDARLTAVVLFLALQALTIATTLLTATAVLPVLYQNAPGWFADLGPALPSLLVFHLTREGFIMALWRTLVFQLNADPSDHRVWP
jgi:hypothetical protein